jgi:hypothetical protein
MGGALEVPTGPLQGADLVVAHAAFDACPEGLAVVKKVGVFQAIAALTRPPGEQPDPTHRLLADLVMPGMGVRDVAHYLTVQLPSLKPCTCPNTNRGAPAPPKQPVVVSLKPFTGAVLLQGVWAVMEAGRTTSQNQGSERMP